VFISRQDRETLGERDKLYDDLEAEKEFEKKKREEKK